MAQRLGTPYYITPEVLEKCYTEKCDVWSCGVIMYILLSGIPPFNGRDDIEIMEKVSSGKYSLSGAEFQAISGEAKDLIRKMLEQNPKSRVSALEAINHDWFKKVMGTQEGEINIDNLKNLKAFNSKSKLQSAVYFFIVNNMATKEEKNSLIKTFKALDLNGDGKLTSDELMAGYNSKSLEFSQDEIDALISKQDNNQSGFIDYTEFVAVYQGGKFLKGYLEYK